MAKAQREWAESLAVKHPVEPDEVASFVASVASSTACGADGAEAGLEAVVPLCLFLSKSLGKFPDAVVPGVVRALEAVVCGMEALVAGPTDAAPGPPAKGSDQAGGQLPAQQWAALLSRAMMELGGVLGLLSLHAQWKAQVSGSFAGLLRQLLAAGQQEQPMLAGFRVALRAGSQQLPLTGADAAQLFMLVAQQHLGLLGGGGPTAAAAVWRQAGDLPWVVAGQLAPLALHSGQLSAEDASRVALGACAAVDRVLRPLLRPDDDAASDASARDSPRQQPAALPAPAFVTAMASLAAQTACCLGERPGGGDGGQAARAGSAAAADVTDALLGVCEDCVAAAAELSVGDRASDALLNIGIGVGRQLLALLAAAGQHDENALADLLPRLQALLAGAARLAELEYFLPGDDGAPAPAAARSGVLGASPGHDPGAKVRRLWVWDLSQDLSADGELDPQRRKRRAWWLTRTLAEGTASLLAAAWQRAPHDLAATFVPLAGAALERPETVPTLGRMLALAGGDEELARLVVPLLQDTLASQTAGADAEAYAVAARSLASMAVCCALHDNRWGYDQVVDLLIKLYKFPNFSISRALLHGTPLQPDAAAPPPPGSPLAAARQGPDVPIVGRCPGALADALLQLAEGVRGARLALLKDLRTRLLTLFADFALILPSPAYVRDLGALLPALGAVGEAVAEATAGRMSASLSAADLSLDALNTAQEEDLLVLRLFRQLWLYCGVYDFAGEQRPSPSLNGGAPAEAVRWPEAWRAALGRIAAVSPLLIVGWEQYKPDEMLESLASEFGGRLAKLGRLGEAPALLAALAALLGPDAAAALPRTQLPAPMAAHLLTQATKSLCRARFSSHEACAQEGAVPVWAPLRHMQLTLPGAPHHPWQQLLAERVFDALLARLAADQLGLEAPAQRDSLDACAQQLAQVLAGFLVQQGPNAEVAALAGRLLSRLLAEFPALQYRRDVLAALFQAAHEEEQGTDGGAPPQRLAFSWLSRLLRRTAAEAPGPTEAALFEQTRREAAAARGSAADVITRYMPEVLQLVRSAAEGFPMSALRCRMPRGAQAWSAQLHCLGRVAGLAQGAEARELPPAAVPLRCARALAEALRGRHTQSALADTYLQAAAALVQHPGTAVSGELLRLLAWAPAKRFCTPLMRVAVLAWHWVLAACGAEVQLALLTELGEAWGHTVQARLGLFAEVAPQQRQVAAAATGGGAAAAAEGGEAAPLACAAVVDEGAAVEGVEAHHLWVCFMWEVSQRMGHDPSSLSGVVADTMWRQLSTALQDGGRLLTAHPASTGARFRLLRLSLAFCSEHAAAAQRRGRPCPLPVVLLGELALAAGLRWFELPEAWHDAEHDMLREALSAVRDFAEALGQAALPQLPRDLPAPHPAWGHMPPPRSNAARQALLALLLSTEVERLAAWADPLDAASVPPSAASGLAASHWATHVRTAWEEVSPRLALALARRFPTVAAIGRELAGLVARDAAQAAVQNLPEAALLLATPAAAKANAPQLQHLAVWAPLPLLDALALAAGPAGRHPAVLAYVMRSLGACAPEDVAFFLPQLVQLLRWDQTGPTNGGCGPVQRFLLDAAARSVYFAHMLVCQLLSEGTPPEEAFNPAVKRSNWSPPQDTGLWSVADRVRDSLLAELHGGVRERLDAELRFFDDVTAVSGKLYPVPKDERKAAAVQFLREVKLPRDDLYIPTNPDCRVLELLPESAAPMQSAAKCPILAAFRCERAGGLGGGEATRALIFKVGDDCRQDVLALQVLRLLKGAFDGAGLPLYLAPYGVVPTGHEQGIIEVIPHAKSRAQLGEMFDGGLLEIFRHEFGMPGAPRFEAARRRFLESCAAYSVATYLLWAKDRHNGNLMLDNQGRLLHIDFGYILGISPGGNLGFETAPFKLSYEMTQLLDPGGTRDSPTFRRFTQLCVRGFLAARSVADSVVAAVALLAPSQLPCYGYGKPVDSLRARFKLELSDAQAAAYMRGLVLRAYDKWTTGGYDLIQYYQNAIPK